MKSQPLAIHAGEVFTPGQRFSPGLILIEEGKVSFVGPWQAARVPANARLLEAEDKSAAPGLVDVHIHGSAGADCLRDGKDGLQKMARFLASHGVTSFLPSTPSAPLEELEEAVEQARMASLEGSGGAEVLGIHLEGPYLSAAQKGAHVESYLRKPNIQECAKLVEVGQGAALRQAQRRPTRAGKRHPERSRGAVKMLTLAPELEGALDLIRWLRERNIVVSLGHSAATYEQTKRAIEAGADHGCHVFNAMRDMSKREPGIVGAVLEEQRVYAELIVDLVHVHPVMLKIALRMKDPNQIVLISDAIEAAGMPDGIYELSGLKVEVKGGIARLDAATLAGSTLTLDCAVKNAVEALGVEKQEALAMASENAADSLRLPHKGRLQQGADGDVVILNPDFSIWATIVKGEVVYQQEG